MSEKAALVTGKPKKDYNSTDETVALKTEEKESNNNSLQIKRKNEAGGSSSNIQAQYDVQRWVHTFISSFCHTIFFITFGIIDIISLILISKNKNNICLNSLNPPITPYNYLLIGSIVSLSLIFITLIFNLLHKKQITQINHYNESILSFSKSFRATKALLSRDEAFLIIKYIKYLSVLASINTLFCVAYSIFGFVCYGQMDEQEGCGDKDVATVLILAYAIIKLVSGVLRFFGQCANDMATVCGYDVPPSRIAEGPWSTFNMRKEYQEVDKAYE